MLQFKTAYCIGVFQQNSVCTEQHFTGACVNIPQQLQVDSHCQSAQCDSDTAELRHPILPAMSCTHSVTKHCNLQQIVTTLLVQCNTKLTIAN